MTCAERIINKIEHLYKNRVAFVCYNASMWDSLESVYLLAKEKGWKIDLYAPYYLKGNSTATDKKQLKKLVKKNIKTRLTKDIHYDIIFNNNPYDDGNLVTRLDSNFYNKNLVNICDYLIFIPYASTPTYYDDNAVVFNGVLCSDMVVVENEFQKERSCKVLHDFFLENMGRDLDFSGKYFVFGSPKYDKIVTDTKENHKLPRKWKKLIGNKQIVVLNTSLKPFLNDPEHLIKIGKVIDKYYNNENYILWWRPHPLMIATIERLRPNLLDSYLNLVKWYKKNNVGIYDDTEDLHRSILYSDLCISDKSSVTFLYEKINKKLIFLNDFVDKLEKI